MADCFSAAVLPLFQGAVAVKAPALQALLSLAAFAHRGIQLITQGLEPDLLRRIERQWVECLPVTIQRQQPVHRNRRFFAAYFQSGFNQQLRLGPGQALGDQLIQAQLGRAVDAAVVVAHCSFRLLQRGFCAQTLNRSNLDVEQWRVLGHQPQRCIVALGRGKQGSPFASGIFGLLCLGRRFLNRCKLVLRCRNLHRRRIGRDIAPDFFQEPTQHGRAVKPQFRWIGRSRLCGGKLSWRRHPQSCGLERRRASQAIPLLQRWRIRPSVPAWQARPAQLHQP